MQENDYVKQMPVKSRGSNTNEPELLRYEYIFD
jgi:hypothetical protein